MKAVVVSDTDTFSVEEIELAAPQAGEVKVKMVAAGVCHSDLSVINGTIPAKYPIIIGHEGAGIVEEVGEGVTNVKAGDHVILSFVPFCQDCFFCDNGQPYLCEANNIVGMGCQMDGTARTTKNGTDLQVMSGLGCMSEYIVCPSISVVPISDDIPLEIGALVGCGVTTGVGAVLNTAEVEAGSSVAVIGCGGVGLSAIQGAKVAGASTIIAIDLSQEKLDLAQSFGATHGLIADDDLFGNVKGLTGGKGVDYAFEIIGFSKTMELAYNLTRNGGVTTLVGIGKHKDRMSFSALAFPVKAKKLCGCMYGSANPPVDFPRMLELYKDGQLELDKMITKTYSIDEAPEAFRALDAGENARGVIVFK